MRTHTNTQVKGQRFLNEYRKQNWPIKKDTDVLWTNQKLGSNEVADAKRGKTSKGGTDWFRIYFQLDDKIARVLNPIAKRTNREPKPTRITLESQVNLALLAQIINKIQVS